MTREQIATRVESVLRWVNVQLEVRNRRIEDIHRRCKLHMRLHSNEYNEAYAPLIRLHQEAIVTLAKKSMNLEEFHKKLLVKKV